MNPAYDPTERRQIMSLQPFPGFVHFPTHHCVTGSLRHIYAFHGYPISEELLLGLGAGVGFIYWHMKGAPPFIGGRANIERPGEEGLEKTVGRRTGVQVTSFRTDSAAKAERSLLVELAAARPVMLVLDMGFLPYFDFGGQEYHFGYHVVVACGYDPQERQVLLADRDEALHPVSLATLARARGSTYKPFPPHHTWYTFDFSRSHPPQRQDILEAIRECARGMLEPPIANLGVKGIRTAAERVRAWPKMLGEDDLRETCANTAIMIDARGGTGGGLFRAMYGRFLAEAADLTGKGDFLEAGRQMQAVGARWDAAAALFEQASRADEPTAALAEVCALLPEFAVQEEAVWRRLLDVACK
jgi:hypothetical protein